MICKGEYAKFKIGEKTDVSMLGSYSLLGEAPLGLP